MNLYSITLFVHIISAIANFFGNGILLLGISALRRTKRVDQVRTIGALMATTGRIFPLTLVLLVATGLLLSAIAWGVQGWDGVALVSFVLLVIPIGAIVVGPRIGVIVSVAGEAPDGPLPVALDAHIHDPVLGTAVQTITALLLGIVFLMTTKPTLIGSVLVMVIVVVLGVASGWPLARPTRGIRRQE